ncbi:MAG: GIY-YIG nuclease family protein [Candidatus Didemnitutus sp.]|nr:GIY-YIG nuclease family protein [Candidatus Didemnitutus sp.]
MFSVYLLRGANGRHYIGQTSDVESRLAQHRRGQTHTTRRLGGDITLVAYRSFPTRSEAVRVERLLKSWKNPMKVAEHLGRSAP